MKHLLQKHSKYLWLSLLLLLVGATAIAIPRINGINEDSPVAKIGDNGYATLQAAIEAAESGATIELLQDVDLSSAVTGTSRLPISKSLTFNGNNRVITMGGRGFGVGMNATSKIDVVFNDLTIENSANGARCIDTRGNVNSLTLNNVILKTDGATSGYTQPLTIGGNQAVAATVNITNSTIQTNNDGTAYYAIITFNPVNMTISNSTIKGWACIYAKGPDSSAGSAGSVFTLDGCTVVSTNKYSGESNSFGTFMMEDNNVTINVTNSNITINNSGDQDQAIASYPENTSYTGAVSLGEGNNVQFNSTGTGTCSFVTNGTSATFEVSGGTFNTPVPEEYCAEGFTLVDNGDGTYSVAEPSYVAQIEGGAKYATLQAAVDAAKALSGEQTITLLSDITGETVTIPEVANFKLTIDGKKNASSNYTVDALIIVDGLRGTGSKTNGASVTLQNIAFVDGDYITQQNQTIIQPIHYPHHLTIKDCTYIGKDSDTSRNRWFLSVSDGPLYEATIKNVTVSNTRLISAPCGDNVVFENITATNGITAGFNAIKTDGTILIKDCNLNVSKYAFRDAPEAYTGTITFEGNTFTSTSEVSDEGVIVNRGGAVGTAHINVESGTYTGHVKVLNNKEGVLAISGGYFSEEFPQNYLAADLVDQGKVCVPAPDMEGYFTIGDPTYVAQIGESKYVSLQAAVDAAHEMTGDVTITLIDNIEGYSIVHQKAGLNLIIDGAEKTVNGQIIVIGDGRLEGAETLSIQNIKFEGNTSNFYSGNDAFIQVPSTKTAGTPYYNTSYNNHAHNITISGCSFTGDYPSSNVVAFKSNSGTDGTKNLTMENVTATNLHSLAQLTATTNVTFDNCSATLTGSFIGANGGGGTYTVSNCTFESHPDKADGYAYREKSSSAAVATLSNNNFKAFDAIILGSAGTINVESGTYIGNVSKTAGNIVISGGQFSVDLTDTTYEPFIAEGKIGVQNNAVEEAPYSVEEGTYVAQVTLGESTHKYGSLEAAIAAAADGSTVKLLDDCAGNGIVVPQGKYTIGLTVDFDGYTYTMDGSMVGSTGTETQAFQLLKDNTITFKNGTIISTKAKILVQNYSNLTLEGMTLTLNNENYNEAYTLSNNNGNVVIDGTTINANPAGGFAFDVCRYSSYESVSVTVTGDSEINGNVEVYASGSDAKNGFSLMLESGNITGDIVIDATAGAAMAATPDKAIIKEKDSFNQAAPTGYMWVSDGEGTGTSTLAPRPYVAQIGDVKYWSLVDAVAAVPADGTETTIVMIADESIDVVGSAITISATKNVILDLNGFQVVGTASAGNTSALVTNNGTLTIKDSSDTNKDGTGTGKLMSGADPTWTWDGSDNYAGSYASNTIDNRGSGTLIIESGYIKNLSTGSAAYAIDNYNAGNVTINGGKVDATRASAIRMFYVNGGSISVNGGVIGHNNSENDRTLYGIQFMDNEGDVVNVSVTGGTIAGYFAFYAKNSGGSIDISGGTFDGYVGFAAICTNDLSISGGSFNSWVGTYGDHVKFISGGIYAEEVAEEYIADGCILAPNTDPDTKEAYPYTVKIGQHVAKIGNTKYETLEEAFAAVQDGETITLLADCAGNGIFVGSGKFSEGVTVDFNNFTYTVDGTTVGSPNTQTQAFHLEKDNKFTFKNGTIYSENAKMLVQNYSDLTLEGMTLTLDNENYTSAYTLSNNNGNVVIDGTTINANPAGGFAFDVCRYSSYTSVNVTVTGESVINGNIEFDAGSGDPKDGVSLTVEGGTITGNLSLTSGGSTALTDHSDKASVTKNDAIELAAPVGFKWVSNGDGTSTLKPCEYICAIGSVKYETLAEAVAAAGTSETTITLLEEAAVDGVISGTGVVVPSGSNITFDLNGLTYNVTGSTVGSTGTETQGFQLLKESNITFKNGTLKATSPTAQMVIQNYSNLTLEDVTIDGTGLSGWAYALSNNCGTINLTGSTSIIAKEGGRAFDTCKFGSYDIPTVNINTTGTITGPIEATGGKLNIENGKFDVTWVTDSHYAEGDIQITGGVFTEKPAVEYCAEGYVPTFNTDPETKADYPYAVKSKDDDVYELVDAENYPFMDLPSDITVSSVTYKRTFSSTQVNKHQAWFVPMDYTITADDVENFTFYKIQMIAGAAEAGEADHDKIYLYIEPMSEGEILKGNRPYTVKPKNTATDYEFTAENTTLYAPTTKSRLNVTTSFHSYDFYGKYANDPYTGSVGDWFSLAQGSLHPNPASTTFRQYRWIIEVTANTINDDYSKIEFSIVEDGDATGIDRAHIINSDEVEGIYTTNGLKVDEPVRGINIIRYKNGKTEKIIVK